MNASTKLLLRKDYQRADGKKPVYLRLIINRTQKYFSLGIYLLPSDLLKRDQFLVKDSVENSFLINIQLRDAETRASEILNDFSRFKKEPSFLEFSRRFKNKLSRDSFYDFANKYINNNIELAKESRKTYTTQLSKLEKFIPKSKQTFQEINNLDFIESYKNYMIKDLNNKLNTQSKSLSFIRTILNDAKRHSIIANNAFENVKLKRERGTRHFLTYEEIIQLKNYYNSANIKKEHKNVLQYFLYSCYTGLRFHDIKNLSYTHIKTYLHNSTTIPEERLIVSLKMHKTQKEITIPLVHQALELIDLNKLNTNEKVFNVISNQKTNKNLKQIFQILKFDNWQNLSYHSSRHSFASHLIKILPIKTVSESLGHTEVRTTEIYTHLVKDDIINSIDKAFNQ